MLYFPIHGSAEDESGNNLNGVAHGVTLCNDRFGVPNEAYYFHGTDAYIEIPSLTKINPQFPFSVSVWVYFEDLNNYYRKQFSQAV